MNTTLSDIKWLVFGIAICAAVGALIATIQVVYFEQTESGRYSVHEVCKTWNEACIRACEDAQHDNPQNPPSCDECCLETGTEVEPLGQRLKDLIFYYSVLGGGIGITVGLTIADQKRRQLNNI